MSTWSFGKQSRAPSPGEPLYTIAELAARLKTTEAHLRGLLHRHKGLEPWRWSRSTNSPYRQYYRLSDARKWWLGLSEDQRAC